MRSAQSAATTHSGAWRGHPGSRASSPELAGHGVLEGHTGRHKIPCPRSATPQTAGSPIRAIPPPSYAKQTGRLEAQTLQSHHKALATRTSFVESRNSAVTVQPASRLPGRPGPPLDPGRLVEAGSPLHRVGPPRPRPSVPATGAPAGAALRETLAAPRVRRERVCRVVMFPERPEDTTGQPRLFRSAR